MSDRQSHPAAIARLRRRAKDVLNLLRGHDADAAAWLAGLHPAFRGLEPETVCGGSPRLADVQLAVARECGFGSWPQLRAHVGLSPTPELAPLRPVEADLIADPTYRSELAAAKGLAPVGAAAVSRHGVSYIVEDHVLAATTANLARCAGKRPDFRLDDLLPRIRFANLPARLANLLREVDTCTGKELVFLDTVPSLHPQTAIPGRHQVLNTQDPRCILFHLDAQDLHEIVLAHELGHIWLELVEGIEDFRVPRSLADLPRVTQLHLVQSFVLDIRVNALLAQRGFDLSVIDDAEQDALRTLAQQCA
ncbi:MAG: hypothetical protein HZB16_19185, partial [Armatimonadetes bacterium]|nr:hypothetical protein [Armatimonadota bacterium]